MKKSNALSILEVSLILMFVAVTSFFGWQSFTNKDFYQNLLNLSAVHQNTAGSVINDLKSKFKELLASLQNGKGSTEESVKAYNNKRVETTGVIGQMIAAYNQAKAAGLSAADEIKQAALDALKNLALDDTVETGKEATEAQTEAAEKTAEACLASPSSCTTLMTVTTLSATLVGTTPDSTYYGGKFPIDLTYSYKYIDDSGNEQIANVTQTVYIQKEQNASSEGKMYSEFLPDYIKSKLSSAAATGSATEVQALLDSYLDSTNDVLSKKSSQYYDFSTKTMYDCIYKANGATSCNG